LKVRGHYPSEEAIFVSLNDGTSTGRLIPPERRLAPQRLEARKQEVLTLAFMEVSSGVRRPRLMSSVPKVPVWLAPVAGLAVVAGLLLATSLPHRGPARQVLRATPVLIAHVTPHQQSVSLARPLSNVSTTTATLVVSLRKGRTARPDAVAGGRRELRDLVTRILDAMPGNAIAHVAIIQVAYQGRSHTALRISSTGRDPLRRAWERDVLVGAFQRASHRASASNRQFPHSPKRQATVRDIRGHAAAAAAAVHAKVEYLAIYQTESLAAFVVLGVSGHTSDALFVKHDAPVLLREIGGAAWPHGGVLLEVINRSGAFVWGYETTRTPARSSIAVRVDLAGCVPILPASQKQCQTR
jgi:hypothetical protein